MGGYLPTFLPSYLRTFVPSYMYTGAVTAAWVGMVGMAIMGGYLADVVAKAHELEPTASWARWHR